MNCKYNLLIGFMDNVLFCSQHSVINSQINLSAFESHLFYLSGHGHVKHTKLETIFGFPILFLLKRIDLWLPLHFTFCYQHAVVGREILTCIQFFVTPYQQANCIQLSDPLLLCVFLLMECVLYFPFHIYDSSCNMKPSAIVFIWDSHRDYTITRFD